MSERMLTLKRRVLKVIAPPLVSSLINLLFKTIKWEIIGKEHLDGLKGPVVFAFFHGRMAMLPKLYGMIRKNFRINMILSPHFDGELGAKIARRFGIGSLSGSSSKKSFNLLKKVAQLEGIDIGITPDGPKGPNEKVKSGVIYIAKLKGYPIVPVTYSVKDYKTFNSWDKFMLPRPFTKGVYVIGEPIAIPKDLEKSDIERYALFLEEKMRSLKTLADEKAKGL